MPNRGLVAFPVFAVSLGAPFWFDVLNKLVNLRADGKKPETTEERLESAQPGK
jgi:hypothetical protein